MTDDSIFIPGDIVLTSRRYRSGGGVWGLWTVVRTTPTRVYVKAVKSDKHPDGHLGDFAMAHYMEGGSWVRPSDIVMKDATLEDYIDCDQIDDDYQAAEYMLRDGRDRQLANVLGGKHRYGE